MPLPDPAYWTDHLRGVLRRYDEPLLRQVCARLLRPRNQWPVEELIERMAGAAGNPAVIDRRLLELEPAGRKLLALVARSRQPSWQLGHLIELLVALGHAVDFRPVLSLFEEGLLYPDLPDPVQRLKNFEQWLNVGAANGLAVFAHPDVAARALGEDLVLPDLSGEHDPAEADAPAASRAPPTGPSTIQESDGLEWPLRLAVLWQQVAAGPLRRTQQGGFFKRDLDRLRGDAVLNGVPADHVGELPDIGLVMVELALAEGLLRERDGEITAADMPPAWGEGLPATLSSLWAALPRLRDWNAAAGWQGPEVTGNPYPSAALLAALLLSRLPAQAWARPETVEEWVQRRHPYWAGPRAAGSAPDETTPVRPPAASSGVAAFLLGFGYPLRLVQATRAPGGGWLVRLSPLGRWMLGLGEPPVAPPAYTQTLLVQPNLEIVAYRQGLTPALLARVSRFASWKGLGAACILKLEPESVYRGLQTGLTFDAILQTLEQHGMRGTPAAVVESLRTWANKRERLAVYPAATLFEFNSAADLQDALARGLPAVRLSDRLALVPDEAAVDFRHFRLVATRDYGLPLERCVEVETDGVTLTLDLTRSDLLLETELPRFAERLESASANGRRQYRLTPASLAAAQQGGMAVRALEEWFVQRAGQPLSAAARLLLMGGVVPALDLRNQLVLHVSAPEVADGLMQWPGTRSLIQERLGPTAVVVAEEHVEELRQRLQALGITLGG
jgi:hypothetical protein